MTVEYIRYRLTAHTPDDLMSAYAAAGALLSAAPECRSFALTQCEEEPTVFILRIVWTSTRDHLEGFRKGPHFPPFFAAIRAFIGEIEEMRHYRPTAVSWTADTDR
ncbi:MAG: antibiotic biosynthesis monooxygenase [Rhodoplanes sp.]|uniref:putative quinol monooxygenase n=1 Tax=Rhodoplanes sp. TaxID=1968906 RepID=UPI0017A58967|nr:antibiotic biosynthesis monooxygenase [Rhodoplanes sp.]NVO16387.1 antibiotic biosynthesis monooxygenase [Rhodoplanes sp.]